MLICCNNENKSITKAAFLSKRKYIYIKINYKQNNKKPLLILY